MGSKLAIDETHETRATEECFYLYVFRVEEGLGNACLLKFPDGTCGILDWGTQGEKPLKQALQIAEGGLVRFIAASHAHADHTLGLPKLLRECKRRNIEVEKFVYPASTLNAEEHYLTKAREAALECGIEMFSVNMDVFLAPPGERRPPALAWADDRSWDVRVLSPSIKKTAIAEMRALHRGNAPGNETSLVVLFRFLGAQDDQGFGKVLLPGDATPATLEFARQTGSQFPDLVINNQAFLVPHHGSAHNLPGWLKDYVHGVTVVSSPTDSAHHPSPTTLEDLAAWTPGLFCTSYALCCRKEYGSSAGAFHAALVQPGSCFGDIVIRVPRSAAAALDQFSADGHARRPFGYCGNLRPKGPTVH